VSCLGGLGGPRGWGGWGARPTLVLSHREGGPLRLGNASFAGSRQSFLLIKDAGGVHLLCKLGVASLSAQNERVKEYPTWKAIIIVHAAPRLYLHSRGGKGRNAGQGRAEQGTEGHVLGEVQSLATVKFREACVN